MLQRYALEEGRLVRSDAENARLQVYTKPDEAERRFLVDHLLIDEHTLQSALDPDEISRLEFEPEHVATIFKIPRNRSIKNGDEPYPEFGVASVGAFLLKDRVVVVQSEDLPLYDTPRPLPKGTTNGGFLLRLLGRTITHFHEHLKAINAIGGAIEDQLHKSMENRHLLSLFGLEKSLVYYLSAINTNDALLQRLRNNVAKLGLTPEETETLDDIAIENAQCARQAAIYSEILTGMMDARASIVSNNLNVLIKTLNVITIGIMVPTMVVSIFSMNVRLPLADHPNAFWIVMGMSAATLVAFWAFGKHKKW